MTTRFEVEHRERLEQDARDEEASNLRRRKNPEQRGPSFDAKVKLALWDKQIMQIITAPPGMVVRRMGTGEKGEPEAFDAVVVALGLQRDGRVVPIELDSEYGMMASSDELISTDDETSILIDGKEHASGPRIIR